MKSENVSRFADAKYVDILTTDRDGSKIGYRIQGAANGPNVLVAGYRPMIDEVFYRLVKLPTIPWLRGSIGMVMLEALEAKIDPVLFGPKERIDEILFLPYTAESDQNKEMESDCYWSVLRLCARLGMIDGRGIPLLEQY